MPKQINESLSALMDGEVDELELRRILNRCDKDPSLYESWRRMQSIRSILNDESVSNVDLSIGIRQALDGVPMDEVPEVLPKVSMGHGISDTLVSDTSFRGGSSYQVDEKPNTSIDDDPSIESRQQNPILGFATLAKISSIAAMVGFVSASLALVVADKFQSSDASRPLADSSDPVFTQDVQLASTLATPITKGQMSVSHSIDKRLDAYLLQHAEFSSINTGRGLMPFARVESWRAGNSK